MKRVFLYLANTMIITKTEIKLINALKKSHGRKKHQAFIVEGVKMVEELLHSQMNIQLIAATKEWETTNPTHTQLPTYREITKRELQKISTFSTSNQVIAVVELPESQDLSIQKDELVLVLDTIQDPGNLGTIIRTADWYGIQKIVCSKETADAYNSKVIQSSMGSVFRIPLFYTNLAQLLKTHYKTHHIYGSLLSGENIYKLPIKKSGFIVIGNESKGISPEIQELITQAIYIPKNKNSKAESLNAAIACSIILSEFYRV